MSTPAGWLGPDWRIPGVRAVMSTREGGRSGGRFTSLNLRPGLGDDDANVRLNQARFAEVIGAAPVWLDQVHGARVVRLFAADASAGAPVHAADASVTSVPGIACCVQVADCLPVLFAARNGRAVGAAHAGWRGLATGVVEAAAQSVAEAAACASGDVVAWLGACIGPERFEVGADVLAAFDVDPTATSEAGAGSASRHFRPGRPGRWLADLPGLARDRLAEAGVVDVGGGGWCTVTEPSRFFSFRRDGVTGRMAAAVALHAAVG